MTTPATDAPPKGGTLAKFAPFPKPFWVINGVELFERGAYYGMLAILSVFMTQQLNIPPEQTGILLAIQFPLLYFFPVVAAALADKVGWKSVLVFSFVFLIGGYLALWSATDFNGILLGVTLYGLGAGAFKPIPAATVSLTTSEENRNFGFAIYYWLINLGAFAFPLGMQAVFGGDYRPYFLVSVALSVVNLALVLLLWKDIKTPDRTVKVGAALKSLGELFRHPSFLVLLVIYSGFWFMYAMTTSFLTVYGVDYGILDPALVATVVALNALTIIVLGPLLGKLTGKLPSVPLMIAGITIYVGGFILIGFSGLLTLFLAGIVIYSIGEFLTHPGFLAYVSKIAPRERVAVFLGYGFLPIGVGQFLGTLAGGVLYGRYAREMGKPELFWAIISSVGLITIAALLLYNRAMTPRTAAPARRSRGVVGAALAIAALLLVPALVGAGALVPAQGPVASAATGTGAPAGALDALALPAIEDQTAAGEVTWVVLDLPANATGALTLSLLWRDEAAPNVASTNAPDSMRIHVEAPNGTMVAMSDTAANPQGGEGKLALTVSGVVPGAWRVGIELVDAGPTTMGAGPLTLPGSTADAGNAWTLEPSVQTSA